MQAVIRSTLGISEEQSRHTSGVHIRLWSSSVKAWLAVGHKARHATTQAASCSPRTHTCRFPIVPSSLTVVAVAHPRRLALESMHDGRREFFHLNATGRPRTVFC